MSLYRISFVATAGQVNHELSLSLPDLNFVMFVISIRQHILTFELIM